MKTLLAEHELILTQGAIVERLRRSSDLELHPSLIHAAFIYNERGRQELQVLYQGYIDIARAARLPMLLSTPTWRANLERVKETGVNPDLNADWARFLFDLRESQGNDAALLKISGFIGCKNDCYRPEESQSAAEAEEFHSWQLDRLAQAGVDFLEAGTLPNVQEALGIAKAMERTGTPYTLGFVIDRNGIILDGTSLWDAVRQIDAATTQPPLCYMVSCSYPTFVCADKQPRELFTRLLGYAANASSLSHAELDGAEQLQQEDVSQWAAAMLHLNREYGVKILGGCCGTTDAHISALARAATA